MGAEGPLEKEHCEWGKTQDHPGSATERTTWWPAEDTVCPPLGGGPDQGIQRLGHEKAESSLPENLGMCKFPADSVVKSQPANTGDTGSIPRSGRSPGEGDGNPLQYSCLENFMDRRAWRATVHDRLERKKRIKGETITRKNNGKKRGSGVRTRCASSTIPTEARTYSARRGSITR